MLRFEIIFNARWYLLVRVSFVLLMLTPSVAGQVCSQPKQWDFYSHGDYKVRQVRIESPIDFFHAISKSLDTVKASLPLQPGDVFSATKASAGRDLIHEKLKEGDKDLDQSLRVIIVIGAIENCKEDAPPRELDLVYRVFTSNYNTYFSHSFELKQSEIERPATTAATSAETDSTQGSLLVKPSFGYNRTRRLFGGMRISERIPGGIFDTMNFSASGSTSSNVEEAELAGAREPQNWILSRLEYRLGYTHSDIPAGTNRIKEGKLQAQFFGATKPLGLKKIVTRFGASIEGGNQQTDLETVVIPENNLANSGYGSLKIFIGSTLRGQRYSLGGSYGLQLGTDGASTSVDFIKHLFDLAATAQFLQKEDAPGDFHKSINLEAEVAGGVISRKDMLPVAERFFGGNSPSDFISNDSWRIRGGPFIRSIPQNRLNAAATIGPIGGTSFYSVNLTVSRTFWGRPIIPKEMAADPEFPQAVEAAKNTARETLVTNFKNKIPAFQDFIRKLEPLKADLEMVQQLINALPSDIPEDSDLGGAIADIKDDPPIIRNFFKMDPSDLPSRLDGFIKVNTSMIALLIDHLEALGDELQATNPDLSRKAKDLATSYATRRTALVAELNSIDFSQATREADEVMQSVTPVLDTFLKELNLYSVSPVAIFDVARIWPDRAGTRFAVGGGLRLSLVNFNVTFGYAVNPNPKFQEGRGAFFFSMDVTDLFR